LRIEDLELDIERHKATRSGVPLNLTPKEFLLLAHLVRSGGAVVSRDEIAEHVWDVRFHDQHERCRCGCRRLRSKVDDPFKTKLIHNDSRRWLQFSKDAEWPMKLSHPVMSF